MQKYFNFWYSRLIFYILILQSTSALLFFKNLTYSFWFDLEDFFVTLLNYVFQVSGFFFISVHGKLTSHISLKISENVSQDCMHWIQWSLNSLSEFYSTDVWQNTFRLFLLDRNAFYKFEWRRILQQFRDTNWKIWDRERVRILLSLSKYSSKYFLANHVGLLIETIAHIWVQ